MKSHLLKSFLFLLLASNLLFVNSCTNDIVEDPQQTSSPEAKTYDASVPYQWNELLIEIDRYSPGYRPPAAARLMAYTGLAVYESVVPGMSDHNSLLDFFPGLELPVIEKNKEYNWQVCANTTYAAMMRYFYPHIGANYLAKIDNLEKKLNDKFSSEIKKDVYDRSKEFALNVAADVYVFSSTDTYGHDAYKNPRPSSYIPPKVGSSGEKLWQPTFPDYTPALFPYWGKVRTFAMSQSDLRAKPPLPYSEDPNSKFYQQANEIRLWVNNLSYEDKWIAEFWSDDFFEVTFEPAARQIAIANQLVNAKNISLDKAVELYAKLGMSMCDAGIATWYSKYIYNVIRPIEYIRNVMDPNWTTALNHPYTGVKSLTPEFPSYPSGHSCFGGSASMVLSDMFGNTTEFTDNCHKNRYEFIGTPRSYNNFIEAGVENAYSRLPLGVHFRMDCDEGLRLGYLAANRVLNMPWRK